MTNTGASIMPTLAIKGMSDQLYLRLKERAPISSLRTTANSSPSRFS